MKKEKIFISHSSKDLTIVESFVENILRLGLNIPIERIFCTSMEGHGIKSGEYIPDRLREEIKIASIALLFISKNYKSSEICLNEVGAAWASLEKRKIIPILLPNTDFKELGFLDFGRIGVKIFEQEGLLKLIQDNKEQLNPDYNLGQLTKQIEGFLKKFEPMIQTQISVKALSPPKEVDEWTECYTNNLYAFNRIMRKAILTKDDGIYVIENTRAQNRILTELGSASFLENLWYRFAGGDYYVDNLKKLPNGNWSISKLNIELKISSMWISKNVELQYEFILIHSEAQEPYKITTDVGGKSFCVGLLNDGTIVSENETLNGYAIIDGETIDLSEFDVVLQNRNSESHWIFFVSDFHKAGFNDKETIAFCKKLDTGEIEVNAINIMRFLRLLNNHPTVIRYR